ncbi:MAG: prolyl oligopeptidase family serine peptidase [Verrucomicrobia bacterium]|nr:prolyl oligopeptidase family serine peptidase [Verrucomicrobiota bacterium]
MKFARPYLECGLAVVCLAVAASRSAGQSITTPPPAALGWSQVKPVPGWVVIPPLTGAAVTNQSRFSAKICAALGEMPSEARRYADPANVKKGMRYRLFKPLHFDRAKAYPLVVCLHGGGAVRSFEDLLTCASPVFAFGPARLVSPEEQARHPAFVVVPWSGGGGWDAENTRLIIGLIEALGREFTVDAKRLYVTGQSMGGYGTWRMLTQYSGVFAAGLPVCGGGNPAAAAKARDVAVWAFHGSADGIVPKSEAVAMINALIRAGGKPIYWEYEGGTHAKTAERAYCEPLLLDWLFAQAKP